MLHFRLRPCKLLANEGGEDLVQVTRFENFACHDHISSISLIHECWKSQRP